MIEIVKLTTITRGGSMLLKSADDKSKRLALPSSGHDTFTSFFIERAT